MGATRYEFVVRGRLTAAQLEALAPLGAAAAAHGDTLLTGRVRDQAELNGLLRRLSAQDVVLVTMRPAGGDADFPATYELRLAEQLSAPMRQAFADAAIHDDEHGCRLVVRVGDQAAFDGVLERIEALGLRLVAVERRKRYGRV